MRFFAHISQQLYKEGVVERCPRSVPQSSPRKHYYIPATTASIRSTRLSSNMAPEKTFILATELAFPAEGIISLQLGDIITEPPRPVQNLLNRNARIPLPPDLAYQTEDGPRKETIHHSKDVKYGAFMRCLRACGKRIQARTSEGSRNEAYHCDEGLW